MNHSFADRVVCITNPTGLGLLLASQLAGAGARIVISTPDVDELARAHEELTRRGVDVLAYPCDATKESGMRELVGVALRWFGRVDAVVDVSLRGLASRPLVDGVRFDAKKSE